MKAWRLDRYSDVRSAIGDQVLRDTGNLMHPANVAALLEGLIQ